MLGRNKEREKGGANSDWKGERKRFFEKRGWTLEDVEAKREEEGT